VLVRVNRYDRGEFLRAGAGGVIAVASGGLLLPTIADAQQPYSLPLDSGAPLPLTPQGDDVAFLAFATAAERAARDLYAAAYAQAATGLSRSERRHIHQVSLGKRTHIMRLDAALGQDAPLPSDFVTVLPKHAVKTKARIVALARTLELLLVGVYLTGIANTQDPGSRLFLGQLLAYDVEQAAWLRTLQGHASPAGLYSPLDLEPAGAQLDQFLSTPDFPA